MLHDLTRKVTFIQEKKQASTESWGMRGLEAGVRGGKEGPETHINHEGKRISRSGVSSNTVVQLNQQSMFEMLRIMSPRIPTEIRPS